MAGLGRAPDAPDPDSYDRMFVHCDVLVVGGGPAGISAALSAGETGAHVVLVDEQAALGGALPGLRHRIDGADGTAWAAHMAERLAAMPEVRVLTRTTLFGYYDHNTLSALERRSDHLGPRAPAGTSRQRLWTLKAARVVLAAGAHERPLVFADNDRPGVMLASAAQRYLNDSSRRCPAGARCSSPTTTRLTRRRATSWRRAGPSPPWSTAGRRRRQRSRRR